MAPRRKLGEILVSAGLIDEIQLRSAMGHQKNWGGKLGSALVELGFVKEDDLARVLEGQLKHHCMSEKELTPQPEALKLISMQDAIKYDILPLALQGNVLTIAMSDPHDFALTDELSFKLGKKIKGVMAVEFSIKKAIKTCYGGKTGRDSRETIKPAVGDGRMDIIHTAPVVKQPATVPDAGSRPEVRKVEPSPELITRALAHLLIEKGIIKREELIEKMKSMKDGDQG